MKNPIRNAILGVAAIGLGFSGTAAFAGAHSGPAAPTTVVTTTGLDLATVEGQEMLDERIERAARAVCRIGETRTGTRLRSPEARKCLSRARASAQSQMASIIENQQRGG